MSPQLASLSISREPIAQVVYETIRKAITDKSLSPGMSISEAGIARMLDVSKTPVREAILRLREQHLIEADKNRRLYVIRPSSEAINSAYDARAVLEAGIASLAAARADDIQLKAIEEAAVLSVQGAEAYDTERFRYWDNVFHTAVIEAAANRHLTHLAENSLHLTHALRIRDVPTANNSIECSYEHVAISKSLHDKDGEAAYRLMSDHIQHVSRNVLSAFKQTSVEVQQYE